MNRRLGSTAMLVLLVATILPGTAVAAATVTNGSFEKDVSVGSFTTLWAGSTAIDGWTVGAGSVDWVGTYWTSFDGVKSVDLNGLTAGTLTQHLATTVGWDYVAGFRLAGNPACGAAVKTLDVSASGASSAGFAFDTTGKTRSAMGWSAETYAFTATGADTVLTFASTTVGSCGPALDLVTLTETAPQPPPTDQTMADCKHGGWRSMSDDLGNGFKNQGDCVSWFATKGRNIGDR